MGVKFEYTGKLSDGRYFDSDSTKKVTIELDDNDLTVSEMLEEFMNFMKAIGYNFDLGDHFDVVNDFKTEKKDDLNFDYEKYGSEPLPLKENVSDEIAIKGSYSGYGAVPPQSIVDEGGAVIGVAHPPVESKDPY